MSSEIAEFYNGKSVFITGATGFMGKVLVEKLLRSCGQLKHIYLLIRSKKGQDVKTRLKELLTSKVFNIIHEFHPNVINKVVAIEGDIILPGLGISDKDLETLVKEVSIVFHSAANVKFEEPLSTAVNYNVLGTRRVIELCHQLSNFMALLYVSTAYSNSNRYEIEEIVYPLPTPPQKIIDICQWMSEDMQNTITPKLMEGFPNKYTYTKCLAENLIFEECHNLPVAIIRPSIVASSWREPMVGWVDSFSGITGLEAAIFKGVLRHIHYKRDAIADVIPVDTSINMMIAIVWYTAITSRKGIQVYNCTSGSINPVTWGQIIDDFSTRYSIKHASSQVFRYPGFSGTESKTRFEILHILNHLIPAYLFDGLLFILKQRRAMVNTYSKLERALNALEYFTTTEFRFSNKNVSELNDRLNQTDKMLFNFDIRTLDWNAYYDDYFQGIREYAFKEESHTLPKSKNKLRLIYFRDKLLFLIFLIFISLIFLLLIYLAFIIFERSFSNF